jgi:hypothetical protein
MIDISLLIVVFIGLVISLALVPDHQGRSPHWLVQRRHWRLPVLQLKEGSHGEHGGHGER